MKKIAVIGAGFAGLSAAACLGQAGFDVTVYEKNNQPGGRARKLEANGFTFDMGPSWYWMPDVFDRFFARFGKKTSDYYALTRLDPSYRIYYGKNDCMDIPAGLEALTRLFDQLEPGSGIKLTRFLQEGKLKYEIGMEDLVYKPGLSLAEFWDARLWRTAFKLHLFQSISHYTRKFFQHPKILQLLEFPVLFLGATPHRTPALYSLMNYADMALGTWYPMGGLNKIVEAMTSLALEKGVQFNFNAPVRRLSMNGTAIKEVGTTETSFPTDYVVAGADYHHIEQDLLPEKYRRYSPAYWDKKILAPSCLLFYIGFSKKIDGLLHHTLFFDEDFSLHAKEIYDNPRWPTSPQFYVSCPSKTDPSVAPEGAENVLVLIPVATGLEDQESVREKYFDLVLSRLEHLLGQRLRSHIVFKRSYAHRDFIADYNSFKGNAYGLASTLSQTAHLRPSIVNKKVRNLFYTGQLTVPGPGVPPSIISGQVVADALIKGIR